MALTVFHVDAFTDKAFAGNPAAVCLMPEWADAAWMQCVAREMNLSDTAFAVRRDDGEFDLRWFTPRVEVDLCGHATLATAHVLWEEGIVPLGRAVRFHTRSGPLRVACEGRWITMSLPASIPRPVPPPEGLLPALSLIGADDILSDGTDLVVVVARESDVRGIEPDWMRLSRIETRGVAVTAPGSTAPADFVSRFFAPAFGINEDPVTGSAHGALARYWAARLSKSTMLAYQASIRGGWVRVTVAGDRVEVGGQAVTVFRAEWRPQAEPEATRP